MSNDLSPRIERHDFANPIALADALAQSVASDLRAALQARDVASLALSGGNTPKAFMQALAQQPLDWDGLRAYQFAGLGYHSPNMEISQQVRLPRKATGFDQEAIATLILSGAFLGFLPDHYAESFVRGGQMRDIDPAVFRYDCAFFAITRRSPLIARAARAFQDCLEQAHSH